MRLISAVGLLTLLGCGTDADAFSHCAANIALSVSHEENPEFAWTPADCEMSELNVTEGQQTQWLIGSDDPANRISSPLRYGHTVPGTHSTGTTPLFVGFFYTVDLWRVDGAGIPRRLISHRFLHQVE